MNREEIIAAAKEADPGFCPGGLVPLSDRLVGFEAVERFSNIMFEAGRRAERDECAKVCDYHGDDDNGYGCAAAIRARRTE